MSCWSWFSSSVNFGPSAPAPSPAASLTICSAPATAASSLMATNPTRNDVDLDPGRLLGEVAQVEGAQALRPAIGAVEEASIDALVLFAGIRVGALDRERAVRQRRAGHLHAAEAARPQHRVELDLGAEDLLHAADVLGPAQRVDEAVEVVAAELDAGTRLDHLVAERTALTALTGLLARSGHTRKSSVPSRKFCTAPTASRRPWRRPRICLCNQQRLHPASLPRPAIHSPDAAHNLRLGTLDG